MTRHSTHESTHHRDEPIDDLVLLSDAGGLRREAMLPWLQSAVVREGRKRRTRRVALRSASTGALAIAVGLLSISYWPARQPVHSTVERETPWHIRIAKSDPRAIANMIVQPEIDANRYAIDDRQLVAALAAIGRPAGLIHAEGSIRLTTSVADALPQPKPHLFARPLGAGPSMHPSPAG